MFACPQGLYSGPENGGWKVITSALAAERVMIGNTVAHLQHVFDRLTDHMRATGDGPVRCGSIRWSVIGSARWRPR